MTPIEARIDFAEREAALRRWQQSDILHRIELIAEHYLTHIELLHRLRAVVRLQQEPIKLDTLEMLQHQIDVLITNHIHTFGIDPSWNS